MKVFISWSGALSRAVAEHLKVFIKLVIQQTEPFISTEDIDKGSVWFDKISNELATSGVGIICLTRDNASTEWILFESGAMARGLTKSRVCTLLIDLAPTDLKPPLSQFNATSLKRDDVFRLVETINKEMGDKALERDILQRAFNQSWPSFEVDFSAAIKNHPSNKPAKHRQPDEMLAEHKAVYAYPVEHYAYWEEALARSGFGPGTFGENLTTSGLLETDTHIGDVLRIGSAVLQVTHPRMPCAKLAHKFGRPELIKEFLLSGRSGFYLRVEEEGELGAGDDIEIVQRDPNEVTVRQLLGLTDLNEYDPELARRAAKLEALPPSWREDVAAVLRGLQGDRS